MSLITALGRNALVKNIKPFFPLLVYAAVAVLLLVLFLYSFRQLEELILQEKLDYLGASAEEKVEEISGWRAMQKRIAESVSRDSLMAGEFEQWLAGGGLPDMRRQRLVQRLDELRIVNGYRAVVLLDRHGTVRLSLPGKFAWSEEDVLRARKAMGSGEVLFSELHRNSAGDRSISLDLVAPLSVAGRVTGAVVLQIDPARSLYPLIQEQHFPSASGESLLVRQDGDDALFLNELRHMKDSALNLRVPLNSPKLPSAMALRGILRTTDGLDYRRVPVVAEMRRIPGSSWIVISKIDRAELFGPITQLQNWSTGIALVYVTVGGLLVYAWLRGYRIRYQLLKEQHAAAVEREMLTRHYDYLTRYANDIIVLTDENGHIVEANQRAEQAYGYTREELLRLRVTDLRDTAEDPAVFAAQVTQLHTAGELRYETRSRRKDGTLFPVEVSARLIKIDGVVYMQGISRDISERKRAEEALRKSERLLKESQQMAHIGSWELDLQNNVLYWSDENYRIFEVDPARFGASYEAFLNVVHPDDRELVNKAYSDSVRDRTPYAIVHRLQFPDRRLKYVREWCETYYDAAGKPLRSVGTTQDVTMQQLAQNALRESAQQIEDMYNFAPCGYHSLDSNGIIVRINDTELQWLGYTREEVVGWKSFADLMTPASRQVFWQNFQGFKERGYINDQEYELVRKDGTLLPVLLNATAVYDAARQYQMSRATLFDMTERRLAEKRLEESEERFRTMADFAPIMIWMADVPDTPGYRGCDFFNQRWHDFTGLTLDQTKGQRWMDIVHPDDRERCLAAYLAVFDGVRPFRLEYRVRRHDGMFRWIQDSGVPRLTGEGRLIGFIGTWIDVTDNKLLEEMRAEMEHADRLNIAGEMASTLAHELNQPLSAAGNYLSVALRQTGEQEWDKVKLRKMIGLAHAQTERAGEIVSHLTDMIRKQRQESAMEDINSLVRDLVGFLEFELQQRSITIILDLVPLPLTWVSRIEIEQVLINLVKNAMDSMDSAPRRELHIATRVIESGFIMVSVSDSGIGIATDELDKVFNPFRTSKKGGLGLGLAICRSLVENYGGKIWAEQNAEEGTVFNFTLPVGVSDE